MSYIRLKLITMIGGIAFQEINKMGEATWSEVVIIAVITLIFYLAVWRTIVYFYKKKKEF